MSASAISPELAALLAAYASAIEENDRAWNEYSRIDDFPELKARPIVKVQVGRTLKGRDDDGNDIYVPIYGYTVADIRHKVAPHLDAAMLIHGGQGPGSEERRERVRKGYDNRIAKWSDELAALAAQRKAMEDAAGLTTAREVGDKAAGRVKDIEAEIISYAPATLADAAAIADWLIKGMADDASGYLTVDAPLKVLATLAQVIDQRPSGIEDDFKVWLAIRNEPTPDTDEAGDERYAQYRALQDKIIRGPAVSARDLAIMFYVDSDAGDSDNSDEFTDRVRAIAEGGANG